MESESIFLTESKPEKYTAFAINISDDLISDFSKFETEDKIPVSVTFNGETKNFSF